MKTKTVVGTAVAATVAGSVLYLGSARIYPDQKLTPGDIDPQATTQKVCTPGYTSTVRDVSEETKKEVFKEYNTAYVPGAYEVDHFISLELGGSNDVKNLWP